MRGERGPDVDLDAPDVLDQDVVAADDAGEHVAVAGQVLGRRLDDEITPSSAGRQRYGVANVLSTT